MVKSLSKLRVIKVSMVGKGSVEVFTKRILMRKGGGKLIGPTWVSLRAFYV